MEGKRQCIKWDLETSEDIHKLFNYCYNADKDIPIRFGLLWIIFG